MLQPILTSQHCSTCQGCCKFRDDELTEAPLFTYEMKQRVEKIHSSIQFANEGTFYRIILDKIQNPSQFSGKKYICPLLGETGCILGEDRPFDCQLWPLYIMKSDHKYCITLARDCPTVSPIKKEDLIDFVMKSGFLQLCNNQILQNPEMIEDIRDDVDFIVWIP